MNKRKAYTANTNNPLPQRAMFACVIIILLLAVTILANCRVFVTSGSSMAPTYVEGISLLAIRSYGEPEVGDVIFLKRNDIHCMKRVAFVAGQDVSAAGYEGYWGSNIIPEGYVYVLGDNTEHSNDSRNPEFGLVAITDIWGKPFDQRPKQGS